VVGEQDPPPGGPEHGPLDGDDVLFLVVGVAARDRRYGHEGDVDGKRLDRVHAGGTGEGVVGVVIVPAERDQAEIAAGTQYPQRLEVVGRDGERSDVA
jgi:hypothetical protein